MGFSEVFYTGLYTALMAFILGMCQYFYKSKCSQIDLCCIKIIRDMNIEEEIDLHNEGKTSTL